MRAPRPPRPQRVVGEDAEGLLGALGDGRPRTWPAREGTVSSVWPETRLRSTPRSSVRPPKAWLQVARNPVALRRHALVAAAASPCGGRRPPRRRSGRRAGRSGRPARRARPPRRGRSKPSTPVFTSVWLVCSGVPLWRSSRVDVPAREDPRAARPAVLDRDLLGQEAGADALVDGAAHVVVDQDVAAVGEARPRPRGWSSGPCPAWALIAPWNVRCDPNEPSRSSRCSPPGAAHELDDARPGRRCRSGATRRRAGPPRGRATPRGHPAPVHPAAEGIVEGHAVVEHEGAAGPAAPEAAQGHALGGGVGDAAARAAEQGEAGDVAQRVVEDGGGGGGEVSGGHDVDAGRGLAQPLRPAAGDRHLLAEGEPREHQGERASGISPRRTLWRRSA